MIYFHYYYLNHLIITLIIIIINQFYLTWPGLFIFNLYYLFIKQSNLNIHLIIHYFNYLN
jgi:hypothetical protein